MKILTISLFFLFLECGGGGEILEIFDVKGDFSKDTLPDIIKDKEELPPFPDLIDDKTPPEVLATSPLDEEINVKLPFQIKVTFSEAIRPETITSDTFRVKDIFNENVKGIYTYDEKTYTATFTPLKPPEQFLYYASPYTVSLKKIIQDIKGNYLKEEEDFSFSTQLPTGMKKYEEIAKKYSPVIYQATDKNNPNFDYLTSFDFDNDFNGSNNVESIKKIAQIKSAIYYAVVETKSHYFITYMYFHPYRFTDEEKYHSGNDTSGATVVVLKYPFEKPIAVLPYFRYKNNEDIRSYVTEESKIVGEKGKKYYGVNWVFKENLLFPEGHYLSYITARSHESCLWIHTEKENILDKHCELDESMKKSLTTIKYIFKNNKSEWIKKNGGKFPHSLEEVNYELLNILGELWARRHLIGENKIFANTFEYKPVEKRPGEGLLLPGIFVEPLNPASDNHGRPPWGWRWSKTIPDPEFYFYDLPRGMFFLDPAYYFAKRHRIEVAFDSKTKKGFSVEYCFNPYLMIDLRDTPDCK